jgi:hypothetical protein
VFEKWFLKRLPGPKREEVTGGWRKLHTEELHDILLFISLIISRKIRPLLTEFFEHDNKILVSIKGMEFLDQLSECQLLKMTLLRGVNL